MFNNYSKILILTVMMTLCYSVFAFAATDTKPVTEVSMDDYKKGWTASIFALDSRVKLSSTLPTSPIGTFYANKSGYSVNDYIEPIGFAIKNKSIVWKGEGLIMVDEPGNYVFALEISKASYGVIMLDGKKLAFGSDDTNVIASAQLSKGMHKLEFYFANATDRSGETYGNVNEKGNFMLRIKRPSDNVPVLAEEVLYVKK